MIETNKESEVAIDQIVITGISGRYPESDNIDEFGKNLFDGVDMVTETDRRWPAGLYGLPRRNGTLKDISKFDAQFFGVNPKQADQMDPQLRMLLEVAYEAIFDSGINPNELRGTRTGVYIGVSSSEALYAYSHNPSELSGYSMTGCASSMLANRLSFFFDFKGPSYTVDTACSSSLVALDAAIQSIKSGYCDYAIVGGTNLLTRSQASLQFQRLGMLSPDGMCKSFDSTGKGYVRSETVSVVFLQKKSSCRKYYAKVVNSRVNTDGAKEEGVTFPSGQVQARLLEEVYAQCKIDPRSVVYVEAHGTGTKAGDPQELNSIANIFTKNRTDPLLIGSTKSNMGHPEPASGLAALSKILISIQSGTIPGNLHFSQPNPEIPALFDGRLKVVDKNLQLNEGLIALNSFGFGGANAHLLLKPNKDSENNLWKDTSYFNELSRKTRLFQFSSRTEQGLNEIFDLVEKSVEDLALNCILEPLSVQSPHHYRGFIILNSKNRIKEISHGMKQRPVWYVFSGMGTQWTGMGKELMQIEQFRQSIEKSALILKPFNLDLVQIIQNSDSETFKRTLNSFVGIASIQIALVDCLNLLKIRPDGILGHSVGELGCAYADGCLTHEETLLAAFYRGKCIEKAALPPGAMAAVGLTWDECKKRCPQGVVPACHNSRDTVTISGPRDDVQNFVQELKAEGVFAREVDSSNVAFHSYYMCEIAPKLKDYLSQVIKEKRLRSNRWISSSIPEEQWNSDLAKYSSAEYHVNNLCSAVLFQEALSHVPENAITIEIAPHALLQAVLKRSLTKDNIFIGLLNKNSSNQIENFFTQLGRLYLNGIDFMPSRLLISKKHHNSIYPIPVKTKFLSPLMKWDHGQSWNIPRYTDFTSHGHNSTSSETSKFSYVIDLKGENAYLSGHEIDGRVLYPATGYLCLVWQSVAKMHQIKHLGMIDEKNLHLPGIEFENVEIHKATILKLGESINFEVNLMTTSGLFELTESGNLVVSGQVRLLEEKINFELESPFKAMEVLSNMTRNSCMLKEEIYKELRLRGYQYQDQFQPIEKSDLNGTHGLLKWQDNWVPFLDAMLQMNVLGQTRGLLLPTRIRSIKIDPEQHFSLINDSLLPIVFDPYTNTTQCGAVQIIGLHATVAPKRQIYQPTIIEHVEFVPYMDDVNNNMVLQSREEEIKTNLVKKYIEKCRSLIGDHNNEASFIKFLTSQNKSGLEFLKSFSDDKILNVYSQRLSNFKTLIDIFFENLGTKSKSQKIRLLEICGSMSYSLCTSLTNLVRSHPQICDQVEIAYVQIESMSDLESHFFDQIASDSLFKLERIDWKVCQGSCLSTEVPINIGKFDLVILNNSNLDKYDNVDTWLENRLAKLTHNFVLVIDDFVHDIQFKELVADLEHITLKKELMTPGTFDLERLAKLDLTKLSHRCGFSEQSLWRFGKKYQNSHFINIDNLTDYDWLYETKTSLNDPTVERVFLFSEWQTSGLIGLVNCLRKEFNGDKIRCLLGQNLDKTPQSILDNDLVMNVYKEGQWGSFRHMVSDAQKLVINSEKELYDQQSGMEVEKENLCVCSLQRGDLSSLRWIQSPKAVVSDSQHVICQVAYAALNFRDIMLATGKLSPEAIPNYHKMQDNLLGMEFSGLINGHKCMGLVSAKGLSTQVVLNKNYLWQVPVEWSLSDAATVPVAYSTAYYALCVRGKLMKGESVLIHAGSGAVGQAAISIALSYGCKVFVTVSSSEKRDYLKSRFGDKLSDQSFANSRDLSFEKHVMTETRGRGVDIVLNSLSEEKLQASVRVLAKHGRFLEIGKFDLNKNSSLGMSVFLKNISFHGILLDSLFDQSESNTDWKLVHHLVQNGIESGVVKPLNATIFDKNQIEQAFRYMAQGKHIGKVLINCADNAPIEALAKIWFDPDQSFIITGGLGGFGLELAQWLIERGVRNLVLTSRSGIRNGYQTRKVKMFEQEFDANVQVLGLDVKVKSECEILVKKAREMSKCRKIGGIFHLAALLEDALLENQTKEKFQKVIDTKYQGAFNLDILTRDRQVMDDQAYFVVFSSVTSGRGNLGQTNYGFANSAMERICEKRNQEGKNALAIQWGAIGDVGLVVESHMNGSNETVVGGTLPQRIHGCLKTLEHLLLKSRTNQSVTWSSFVPAFNGADKQNKKSEQEKSLVETVANIMGIKDLKQISNEQQSLAEMGLDSLMSVEIKQILEQAYSINLNMKEIQALTIEKLKNMQNLELVNSDLDKNNNAVSQEIKILMPSKMLIKLNEPADDEKCIFMVHPIEGHVQMLEELAHKMTTSVYGIQFTKEAIDTKSLSQLAELYWKEIEKVKGSSERINLCGYSFGASVAFEMAVQKTDRVRTLTLLDGSHSYVNVQVNAYKTKLQLENSTETESEALFTFYQQFEQVESRMEFIKMLSNMDTFENRVKYVVDCLVQKSAFKFDPVDLNLAARAFVVKVILSFGYEPKQKLKMDQILLIKSESQTNSIANSSIHAVLGNDYGLSRVFEGTVNVKTVNGDHRTFLQDGSASKVADIITSSFF